MIFVTCLQHVTCTLRQPTGFGSRNSSTRNPDPVNPTRKPAGLTRTRAPPYPRLRCHATTQRRCPHWCEVMGVGHALGELLCAPPGACSQVHADLCMYHLS